MEAIESIPASQPSQDDLYREAADTFGPAIERSARAYEADPDRRRDLLQEIHLSLWRSFACFDARCSPRTWVYRVAHNTDRRHALERLLELIQRLKPLDRQVILSYLEGLDAVEIGEITGISPANVATKVHRIKGILSRRFQEGERHGE